MNLFEDILAGFREFRRRRRWEAFYARTPLADNECGLVVQHGIGDHLIVCALAKAFSEKFGHHVVVAGNPRYAFIAKLFPSVVRYAGWPPILSGHIVDSTKTIPGRFRYANIRDELICAIGYDQFHMLDAYKCVLQLRPGAELQQATAPTDRELLAAREYLEQHQLPAGRTAILGIDTGVTPTGDVGPEFWARIAAALSGSGMVPVQNIGPNSIPIPGIKPMDIPLEEFRAITQAAGHFYAVRSGLCDLAGNLNCHRTVIYPEQEFWFGTVFDASNFGKSGLPDPPKEIVLTKETEADLIAGIKSGTA